MQIEELLDQLAQDVQPIPSRARALRIGSGAASGALIALALLVAILGLRPDFPQAFGTMMFWMKWAFTVSVAWASFVMVQRLGQPGERVGYAWLGLAAPIAAVAMMGGWELVTAPAGLRERIWLGTTATRCLTSIFLLSIPVILGLAWSFRRLAPTRIRLAGFAGGLLAGAASATLYALTCTEQTPAFLATWYVTGILAAGGLGALTAPRLLRW